METWMAEYTKQLILAVETHPEEYGYDTENIPTVLNNMRGAFKSGNYIKESRAIKATCKALKIKHTYKDIQRFIDNHA